MNNIKTCLNIESNNCVKKGHRADDCQSKNKEKEDDVNNILVGSTFYGEVLENGNQDDLEEQLGGSGAPSHITYRNKNMTNMKEFKIGVTVINYQKMKCEIKGTVDMKLQGG